MSRTAPMQPLSPRRRWLAVTLGTLLLVPAFWALLAGLVAAAPGVDPEASGGPNPAAALALGLAIVPFVFIVLAAVSGHPRLPGAVLAAMGLAIAVGGPASALAGDAVTGIVAGVGAGAVVALRADDAGRAPRVFAVLVASVYVFVLVRTLGASALLPAPVLPLTGVALADELSLWWRIRSEATRAPVAR